MDILLLTKATLFAIICGVASYTIIAWHWALRLCLMNTKLTDLISYGLFNFIWVVADIILTVLASPFTYAIYLLSTMMSAKLALMMTDANKKANGEE